MVLDWTERISASKMIHRSAWDQTFVDGGGDDVATMLGRLRCWASSDSDAAVTAVVLSRSEASTVEDPGPRPISHGGRRRSSRRRTLNDIVPTSSTTSDNPGRCLTASPTTSVSGTDWSWTRSTLHEQSCNICTVGTDQNFRKSSLSKSDRDRLYENMPPAPTCDLFAADDWIVSRSNLPEVTLSSAASHVPTTRLLFPVDGVARKTSSSSSTSSVCDSVLELCTASSRCSSCSEATSAIAVTPVGDTPSLPDSGNGSSDAGVDHFRFPRLLSSDPGNSSDRVRLPGGTSAAPYCVVASFLPEWDTERLEAVYDRLEQSGFYYGRLTMDAASERLRQAPVGTFLLRDSTVDRYLFSISVQTCRGTTSIRMVYHAGLFHLDCTAGQEHLMPTFDCALRLVAHYVRSCFDRRKPGGSYVFLESSGRRDTPVLLRRPLYRRVDRLAHLCRRAVHAALSRGPSGCEPDRGSVVDRLQLIPSLKSYLRDYPYEL